MAGMCPSEDVERKENNPKRLERDAADLLKLKNTISDMVNPFDPTIRVWHSDKFFSPRVFLDAI